MIYDLSPVERIAMLSVHTSPLAALGQKKTGGMNVYVRDFTRELARQGIQVDVFTRAADANTPYIQYDLGCGCRVINVPAGPRESVPNDSIAQYLDEFSAGVVRFARDYGLRYDLIHSHYWLSGVVAGKLRHSWGPIPVVHMYHTLGHMKNQIARSVSEFAAPVRLLGEAHAAHVADVLVAATPAEERQLIEYYNVDPAKIAVVSPGVDLARFEATRQCVARRRLGLPVKQPLVLFVGRIEPLKGVDSLLRATALLQQHAPGLMEEARVAIVGGDPTNPDEEMARLQSLWRELGLQTTVQFLGARDQDQLPDYYAAADVVAMPSHYESFGMVALEAMAMGTPVIASQVGGLAHLVQDGVTGYLVPPRSPQALAERLHKLLTNQPLRRRLGDQAREYAQSYSWPAVSERILQLYSVLAEPVPAM
ncbi:MAG: glycosyltransferase [Anaerolineae bacterium]